jgi:hypothetical protein
MELELANVQSEMLVVGSFFKDPTLYLTYSQSVVPKYDFSDETCSFFYQLFSDYYISYSETFTELKLNTFASMVQERLKSYKKYGGYKTIKGYMSLADTDDFKNYFETLKKYSLLRAFNDIGYDVSKIVAHKSFQSLTSDDVCRIVRGRIDKVANKVQAIDEPSLLSENATSYIDRFLCTPSKGIDGPWPYIQKYYRGFLPGNVLMTGALSNSGKGRNLVYMIAYLTLVQKQKILLLANEMSEDAIKLNFLVTCMNMPELQELHGVKGISKPERELALGSFKDDNGNYIYRHIDDNGDYTESEEDYKVRVRENSSEYRDIQKIMQWVEAESEGKFLFKNIGASYEDEVLELEIKKAHTIYHCDGVAYDTLKCAGVEDFAKLAATGTKITEWIHDTKLYCICTFQLTDSTWDIPIENLTSQSIASSKRLMHVADQLQMWKHLTYDDKQNYVYVSDDDTWGEPVERELDQNKNYVGLKIVKNRLGSKGELICFEVQMNENIWTEVGVLKKKH